MSHPGMTESGSASSGEVTIVHPKPPRSTPLRVATFLAPILALEALLGYVYGWWVGAVCAVVTLAPVPWSGRLMAWSASRQPHLLEIRADRITAVVRRGGSEELRRVDGDRLVVRKARSWGAPDYLDLVGPAGDSGSISLGRFDREEVARAALAHGWPWQASAKDDVIEPTTPSPVVDTHRPSCEIALRDGRTSATPGRAMSIVLLAAAVLVLVGVRFGASRWNGPFWQFWALSAGAGLLLLGLLIGLFALLARLSRCTITIDAERVSVRYGSSSAEVAYRSSVVSGNADARWARLRDQRGRSLLRVPLRPMRQEVLTTLRSYGWPVTDEP